MWSSTRWCIRKQNSNHSRTLVYLSLRVVVCTFRELLIPCRMKRYVFFITKPITIEIVIIGDKEVERRATRQSTHDGPFVHATLMRNAGFAFDNVLSGSTHFFKTKPSQHRFWNPPGLSICEWMVCKNRVNSMSWFLLLHQHLFNICLRATKHMQNNIFLT